MKPGLLLNIKKIIYLKQNWKVTCNLGFSYSRCTNIFGLETRQKYLLRFCVFAVQGAPVCFCVEFGRLLPLLSDWLSDELWHHCLSVFIWTNFKKEKGKEKNHKSFLSLLLFGAQCVRSERESSEIGYGSKNLQGESGASVNESVNT